jgi:hypothetical protein
MYLDFQCIRTLVPEHRLYQNTSTRTLLLRRLLSLDIYARHLMHQSSRKVDGPTPHDRGRNFGAFNCR